jgi:glycosyltransferase involved in cell wall biosynthesis
MRIAIIGTTSSSMLGFRKDLIKTLFEEGDEVFALAMDYTDETRRAVKELGAQPVDYFISRAGLNPFVAIYHTLQLSRILKSLSLDIVFSYFSKPVIFGTLSAQLAKIKCLVGMLEGLGYVFTEQPNGTPFKVKLLRKAQIFLYKFVFRFLDHIIFLNHDDPKDLIERNNMKIKNITVLGGIGLNLEEYPFSEPISDPVRFLFIGRLLAEKGIHEFIKAAQIVKQHYPLVEFIVLGGIDEANPGGISKDALTSFTKQGLIIYPGYVADVTEWIKRSSVFVLPSSYREGLPRSTQEAMSVGRPIITTNVTGCRDTVVDGLNGYLIAPHSVDDLVKKMMLFIKDRSLIKSMGLASHQIAVKKYDANIINKQLIFILKKKEAHYIR